MIRIEKADESFKRFLEELHQALRERVVEEIEKRLAVEVREWLSRSRHKRRGVLGHRRSRAECGRCGSCRAADFSRNGYRPRQLVTGFGVLNFRLPRVRCRCGGSVRMPFSTLKPYQRIWHDVVEQVGRWADLGLSLRQMQGEIGDQLHTQVGLRKLNQIVHQVEHPVEMPFRSVPPIILLDAIWVTLLKPTQQQQKDSLKRQRIQKIGEKVCVLVAIGIYPQTGRWGALGWSLADSESQAAWERLLVRLENRGVYRERGVELFIHDGGKGLIAALDWMYPHIPHQRCAFHKLRNLWHAIQVPDSLPRTERLAFKRELIQQIDPIFYAASEQDAQLLCEQLCLDLGGQQPTVVATLRRDWQDTIAFFKVLERFPNWSRKFLRTTSLLERVNRTIRRLFRAAGAFHSQAGLLAAVTRVLNPVRLI
jgi:transposase-like protein